MILHLETSPAGGQRVVEALSGAGMPADILRVDTREGFEAALSAAAERGGLDLILACYGLPGLPAPEALALAQRCCPTVPFIFVGEALPVPAQIELLQRGATDYVLNEDLARLPAAASASATRCPPAGLVSR